MLLKQQNERHRLQGAMLSLFLIISALNVCALSAKGQDFNEPVRVRIFSMQNISSQQAKNYLVTSQVTDSVVAIPGTNAVSVTASPQQLVYATSILKLVDSSEQYDVQFVDIEPDKTLPDSEKIQTKLGKDFSVGTLLEGSSTSAAVKIIIDRYKDKILIISPQVQTETVVKTIQELLSSSEEPKPSQEKPAEDVNITKSETEQITLPVLPQSANDVNIIQAPIAIAEANQPAPEIMADVNKPVEIKKQLPAEDNDMLGEFMTELAEAAKADANAKKTDAEPERIPDAVSEPLQEQMQEPEKPAEEKIQIPNEPQPQPEPMKAKQEELSKEVNEPAEQGTEVEKNPTFREVDIPNGDEILELNLPEKLDIVNLIDLVGRYLKLNYLYDDTKITGSVTVKVQGKIRVRELYNLLESVLKFRGFVMSRKGNLVTIAPSAEVLDQDPRFTTNTDIQPGDVAVTKVYHLQYISTTAAKKLLAEMKLGIGSNITEIPETGTLVVTEYAFRMQRIEELLSLVDVPGPPKEFKLRILKYTIAESLVTKIKALAEQLGTIEITIGTSGAADSAAATRARTIRTPRPTPQPTETTTSSKAGVYIDFDKRTNRILIIGLSSEISAVDNIIDSLDVPQQDLRVIREYEIQYVDILKVVEALKELNIVEGASTTKTTGTKTIANPGQPVPPAPVFDTSSQDGAATLDQPQVVMLETTNSLLVNATPEQHTQISQIISYIDREPVQAAIPYRIYRLENQEPEALAEVLNGLIEKTIKDKEGKIQQTVKYQEDNIAIVPDKNTFSLIVYASKKNQEWIGNLIKTLDTRRPQVLIDVSLVEVTRNDAFQFDLDLVANAKGLVTENLKATALVASAVGGNREASFIGGTTTGFYSADKIQALLTLVNTKGYGRVLAQPKILVNDNEEGTIETTQKTYIAEENQSASGTTGEVISKSTTWKDYNAKIKLTITPQISEGELLRLEVEMLREDFATTKSAETAPPDMTTSNVKTVVTVPDGSTIILGGLNKLNQSKTGGKTPLFGDIPIAGGLFRKVKNSNDERRLYVFVKANILRPDIERGLHQLKDISRKNQIEFEKSEDKFQRHEDFPGIKPELVEPLKILAQDTNEPDTGLPEQK
ncbi:MAG: secretin N-terminal domain-containing protein [Phycisphaerae bacterium]|jgi:type II secretory pathway component GspD/PulD (secretin)